MGPGWVRPGRRAAGYTAAPPVPARESAPMTMPTNPTRLVPALARPGLFAPPNAA